MRDALVSVTGSQARADILGTLFTRRSRRWGPRELGRAAGHPHQAVARELHKLQAAGLVRAVLVEGRRQYQPETEDPVARELARFVHQTRGRVPDIRRILESAKALSLAWIVSERAGPFDREPAGPARALVIITATPKRLIQAQLGPLADRQMALHPMPIAEWVARLRKGETFVRRARRAPKLWVIGSGEELVRWEQMSVSARTTLVHALENWREELSDEWEEDWDPAEPSGRAPS